MINLVIELDQFILPQIYGTAVAAQRYFFSGTSEVRFLHKADMG